jgi:hypothetical protein
MAFPKVWAILAVFFTIPTTAAAQTAEIPEPPLLVVRTFNYFGVSPRDLLTARGQAESILRQAGIAISWLDCPVARGATDGPASCTQARGANDLMLRIGSGAQGRAARYVSMGFSLVKADDRQAPYLATVYGDLIASVARDAGIDGRELLGRAIAHEIGHLLLGTSQHASTGLMRAVWSSAELRRHHSAADWCFLATEAGSMRATLTSRQGATRQNTN